MTRYVRISMSFHVNVGEGKRNGKVKHQWCSHVWWCHSRLTCFQMHSGPMSNTRASSNLWKRLFPDKAGLKDLKAQRAHGDSMSHQVGAACRCASVNNKVRRAMLRLDMGLYIGVVLSYQTTRNLSTQLRPQVTNCPIFP